MNGTGERLLFEGDEEAKRREISLLSCLQSRLELRNVEPEGEEEKKKKKATGMQHLNTTEAKKLDLSNGLLRRSQKEMQDSKARRRRGRRRFVLDERVSRVVSSNMNEFNKGLNEIITLIGLFLLVTAANVCLSARANVDSESKQLQLQLLKSANVELNRAGSTSLQRTNRLQRDTNNPEGAATPTCGYPGSPAHASVTFNTTQIVVGTAASYTCDNGYELLGPPRRLCQANGTWSPIGIPFCVLNVGLGKAAMQSSTAGHGSAQKAVDGSTSPYFQASTCTMTDVEHNPWWYVNLLEPYLVQIVRIDFGTACCANRQKATIAVRVGNNRPDLGNNPLCNRYHGFIEEGKPLFLPCTRPAPGAFVSIHLESPSGSSLSICETFIYTDHALSIEQCPSFRDQPLGSTATYNGKCYLFHNNQALNFDGARKYCESRGGTLVDETSPALQGFLSWELYRRHRNDQLMGQYWLGAIKDTRNPQNWKWINGKDVQISFWNSLTAKGNCSRFDGSKGWLWSDTDCNMNLNFICQYRPLSCGKPEKPTNSTLITKNIDNGTVIEYQCAPGNLLMGPKSRACLPTGFFSEFAPKCKYLDCQFPAMIPNGDYKLLNGSTSYQSVVNYFCNDGYQIYGKATLTCDVDERWNGPPPRCEPLLCSAPVPPSNGYITVTSNVTVPGTQVTYDCRPGYELVGDHLLTCSQSGSWDNSFPYCREKRSIATPPSSAPVPIPTSTTPPPKQRQSPPPPPLVGSSGSKPSGGVQFPSGATFASSRIGSSSTQAPTTTSSTNSSPASLNGLANQFMVQSSSSPAPPQPTPTVEDGSPPAAESVQQNRKASQSTSVSQFVLPPATAPAPQVPPVVEIIQPVSSPAPQLAPTNIQRQAPQPQLQQPRQRPTSSSTLGPQQTFTLHNSNQQPTNPTTIANRQQSSPANKFSFASNQQPTTTISNNNGQSTGFDSTPLATTNSISIHPSSQQPVNSILASIPSTTSTSTMASAPQGHTHHLQTLSNAQSVLASFSPPVRAHNLGSAKYSLDGIIAVAIFGGFIFLGAIITIIVILIRRKSSHTSSIDAQTISTYDSNSGEHNGLYRNYQQAWENLRFASPNSQPKSSGAADVSLMAAHMVNASVCPPVGLKNFSQPVVHHGHHMQHLHGHHNMAMSSSSTSSQSSSLGGDPLLGPHHSHSHHHHQHQHHMNPAHRILRHDEEEEDEIDDLEHGEQGVLSADESNYRSEQQLAGEGFRDTNELTINADTVFNNRPNSQSAAARRRLYSVNSNRLSANIDHHSHHSHHHHLSSSVNSSSQHQRLVPSATPSTSTRSSRASPPSDEHSLEQLAYGNSWHPQGTNQQLGNQSQDTSSNNNSAGSGTSILGTNRANLRYN